jgi:hypothetical protein
MRKLSVLLILVLMLSMVAGVSAAPQPPMTAKGQVDGSTVRLQAPLAPGTLWANGSYDDINGLASELNTAVSDARTADDFELDPACPLYDITQIRATHMNSSVPPNAQVELYADSGGNGPGALIGTYAMTSSALLGYSQFGWEMIEYTYNTPGLQLPPGHYWLSSIGLGDGTFGDRSFFATSGNGMVQLQEGYFLSQYFGITTWTPGTTVYGYTSDYAFDIDGACAQQNIPAHINKTKINWAPAARPGYYKVVFAARIFDNTNAPAVGATVFGTWTYPDGTTHAKTYVTTPLGQAKFPIKEPQTGTYTFHVTDISGGGYVYDPGANTAPDTLSVTLP